MVCRIIQHKVFGDILRRMQQTGKDYLNVMRKTVHDHTRRNTLASITGLRPFLDNTGILHDGGRLRKLKFNYDFKHQIILPSRHHFTSLVVMHYHTLVEHGSYRHIHNKSRDCFWIINGLSTARHYLKNCVLCIKRRAVPVDQLMGNLLPARVALKIEFAPIWA